MKTKLNKKLQTLKYVFLDYLMALVAWVLFFFFRKITIENNLFEDINLVFADVNFYKGIIIIPLFWLIIYFSAGEYQNVYKKSRLKDFQRTFCESIIGVVVIFFAFLLDDYITTYKNYYFSFGVLFLLHFILTYIPRLILTTITVTKVHNGNIGFPAIMIVSDYKMAVDLYNEISSQEISSGMSFCGYVTLHQNQIAEESNNLSAYMDNLGSAENLQKITEDYNIEEVIVVLAEKDKNNIYNIIFSLTNPNTEIYIPSDRKDLLTGNIKMTAIFSTPLVRISNDLMMPWQFALKRIFDILVSMIAIIILIPVYLAVAIAVKVSSKGPVLYGQERIGKNGRTFIMYKFRSMYTDAEKNGPMLSRGDDDPRITPFGRFMRKVRLDEIPQFFHVLKGEMSMVGPRPERQFYVDKIVKVAPEYKLLQKIKPGMTSWGQVKFGYADTVEQMVERLRYDLLYLENMSFVTDIKILLYTFIIIIQGRGK